MSLYLPPWETNPKARAAAQKALELDETLAQAHTSLAGIKFNYDWDWKAAQKELKRSIELNPHYAEVHDLYATFLSAMGRHQEAIAETKRAQELDPLSLYDAGNAVWYYFLARQHDQAIEQGRKVLETHPNAWWTLQFTALAYAGRGRFQEAIADSEKASHLSDSPLILAMVGGVYAIAGKKAEARKILHELMKQSKHRYICPYEIANVYVGLGEKDEAFKWLEKGFRDRSICMVFLRVDPRLDPIRSAPRFQDLLRRMNCPD